MMHAKYKLLVFDWDGTLMDSQREIIQCFQSAAKDLNLESPPDEDIRNIIGIGMEEAICALFPAFSSPQLCARFKERYRHYYFHAEKEQSQLYAGVYEMLLSLAKHGYFLAVATSKGRRGLNDVLARTELAKIFHTTRCIDEALSKPNPQMLLDILDILGIPANEALMIGDTEYDLQMANNANVDAIGVTCGAHSEDRLWKQQPITCLTETKALYAWLGN